MSYNLNTPNPDNEAVVGRCAAFGFFAEYVEDLSASGPRGCVERYEIGLPAVPGHPSVAPPITLRISGSLPYAVRFAARYWSLFVRRPAQRARLGLAPWPAAWQPVPAIAA